ncbi:MAG: electron transport complex subunit E [Candidatus Undinarchaeales archaeon]|jgi:electron transport complex protein RnfE|nr:electron transport complex subunit E [Candidatus Undinarchaeales archaeon]MDP7493697.1 electron transport complex subunit E [Candidatus Undinarchaeales archaeon]
MADDDSLFGTFIRGCWVQNPVLRLLLGMCPTLAVTNTAVNGLVMGGATLFVLVCSAMLISLFRRFIPAKVRIPIFIVVVATFVTIADYMLAAFIPEIHKILGIFVPLIVVNCIILGRIEAFASKNGVVQSLADALGSGLGFTLGLLVLASIREALGFGTIFGYAVFWAGFKPMLVMVLPPGAFLTLGFLIGFMNWYDQRQAKLACVECGGECE